MSHTPGPWEARPADGHVVLNGSSIYAVRDVPSDRYNPDDIRLIAAAPELLAALHDIITCAHVNTPYGGKAYCISDGRMDAARAAINKAEGRTA